MVHILIWGKGFLPSLNANTRRCTARRLSLFHTAIFQFFVVCWAWTVVPLTWSIVGATPSSRLTAAWTVVIATGRSFICINFLWTFKGVFPIRRTGKSCNKGTLLDLFLVWRWLSFFLYSNRSSCSEHHWRLRNSRMTDSISELCFASECSF